MSLALPVSASAFEIETPVSESCHEEMTYAAALAATFPAFSQAPPPTDEQRRAMNDLVFELPQRDPWTLALLIGVRSNDLGDRAPTNTAGLIYVHDDPARQHEHCIRREVDDGPGGDIAALAACRAFIIGELERGGLLEDQLDLTTTESVRSYFKFRGAYAIQLPSFAYRLGRALHAVEDGYAHAMRDPDSGDVRHVLNWVDAFGKTDVYDERRDGYQHLSGLDDCRRTDAVQLRRLQHARDAASAILLAIATNGGGRRPRVERALDDALRLIPDCTIANNYCNAPELTESKDVRSFGCATSTPSLACVVIVLGALLARRRRALAATACIAFAPALAYADEPATKELPKDAPAEEQDQADAARWHFDARAGGAVDAPAISGALGLGFDYKRWSFGVLGEWNPWFSFDQVGSARAGVASLFGTVAFRWYRSDRIALSTRIEVGSTMMLFELLGIDKYTAGIYLGGALTSVRFPINERMSLTFDPIHFALPAPRPFGLPFYYKQYRVTFGVEVAL